MISRKNPHWGSTLDDFLREHSIRVNDQWRVCFVWRAGGAHEVEIVDYH